jgi:hypothetical protein
MQTAFAIVVGRKTLNDCGGDEPLARRRRVSCMTSRGACSKQRKGQFQPDFWGLEERYVSEVRHRKMFVSRLSLSKLQKRLSIIGGTGTGDRALLPGAPFYSYSHTPPVQAALRSLVC